MKVQAIDSHKQNEVTMEGAANVKMRMLIGPDEGAKNFHMRHFELGAGGNTPRHSHDYEHEVLVLDGAGVLFTEQGEQPFQAGNVIFVPAGELHQFINRTDQPCEFICLIPAPKDCTGA